VKLREIHHGLRRGCSRALRTFTEAARYYECRGPRTRAKKNPAGPAGLRVLLLESGVCVMSFALRAAGPPRPVGQVVMVMRVMDELHHDYPSG
jgi:hypothetical protein